MSITYSWEITKLSSGSIGGMSNVISQVDWNFVGTDDQANVVKIEGSTPLDVSSLVEKNLIPISKLDEPTVIGWIEPIISNNAEYYQHLKDRIDQGFLIINNPVTTLTEDSLPWSS